MNERREFKNGYNDTKSRQKETKKKMVWAAADSEKSVFGEESRVKRTGSHVVKKKWSSSKLRKQVEVKGDA